MSRRAAMFAQRGPLLAAIVSALASLPGLWFPFLSDDWAQVHSVELVPPATTPFHDFRPLFMASLWLDRHLWGLASGWFHATNLVLIAAAAALVVVAVRTYTHDASLAAWAGLLFALHPYHVENAAWIGARSDPLFAVPFLLALLAYSRWREHGRGLPLLTLMLFEAALLAKETAVSLPLVILLINALDRERPVKRREWLCGLGSILALAGIHFFLLRAWVLGGAGRTLSGGFGASWVKNGLGLALASVLPVDAEILAAQPRAWGAAGAMLIVLLLALARIRSGTLPPYALASAAFFAVLAAPYVVGFQERYLFLPAAAACVFLAASVRASRGGIALVIATVIGAGWVGGSVAQWINWRQAAAASRALVRDLVAISFQDDLQEVVIANMPFRVRGGSVAGDLSAALALSGGRPIRVRAAAYVSYPSASAETIEDRPLIVRDAVPEFAEVRLRIPEAAFSHLVGARPPEGAPQLQPSGCSLLLESKSVLRVRIPSEPGGGRGACLWDRGRLVLLLGPRLSEVVSFRSHPS